MVIQVREKRIAPRFARVKEASLLVPRSHCGQLVVRKRDRPRSNVLQQVPVRGALRNDNRAALHAPRQHRLGGRGILPRGQLCPESVLQQRREIVVLPAVGWVRVAERRVGDDLDAGGGVEVDKGLLLEVRVGLELVGVGADVADGEDGLDVLFGEVGDADVAGEVGAHEVLHGSVGVDDGDRGVELGGSWAEGDGPVHEVQV